MLKISAAIAVLFAIIALSPTNANATTCATFPYTFTNGTTADASQVMSNYNYLSGCVAPIASPIFNGYLTVSGTNSTTELLTTTGSTYGTGLVLDNTDGSKGGAIYFNDAGSTKWTLAKQASNTAFSLLDNLGGKFFFTANSGGSLLLGPAQTTYLTQSGSVGIGNGSPSYTLQVNGSVAGTSAYVNTSDVRHKKNVKPLEIGLNEIEQLKPVSFEWKDDVLDQSINGKSIHRVLEPMMEGEQIGFIAQDVEKILPSVVVTEGNAEKTKGLKYSEIIPILVKAMQEQQAKIDKLEQEIGELKKSK